MLTHASRAAALGLAFALALCSPASAQPLDAALSDDGTPSDRALNEKDDYIAPVTVATVLKRERQDALKCYGATAPETIKPWDAAIARADALIAAKAALDALTGTDEAAAAARVAQDTMTKAARDDFADALAKAENGARSPVNFRKAVKDAARRRACERYAQAINAAFEPTNEAIPADLGDETSEEDARVKARVEDTIGKTTGVASAVSGTSSALEQPGAPERVVYTVMSALGADSETTGTQLLMTLNLSSVAAADSIEPVQNVFLRNLFLRVGLPLTKTSDEAAAPAASAATGTGADVSRISFVLGGSLIDESDPRLATYDECFDFARRYAPFALDKDENEERIKERQLYYGSCAQIAANSQRLAWRAALGLVTSKDGGRQKTKPELYALALVYGPADWILFNLIGQRLNEPHKVNTIGGGFSVYVDGGGQTPGSQWGRASLDALLLAELRESDPAAGIEKDTGWEARISATASGKVTSGGVAQVSLGPRILSSGTVGLFSTVALSYDADQLINTLLMPASGE